MDGTRGVNTRRLGDLGEQIAASFLTLKGYEIVRKNFRAAGREIDLLARKGSLLVAVEVKLRRGRRFGRAVEAIDQRKLARIRLALGAALGIFKEPLVPRIDLVVIDVGADSNEMIIRHIKAVY